MKKIFKGIGLFFKGLFKTIMYILYFTWATVTFKPLRGARYLRKSKKTIKSVIAHKEDIYDVLNEEEQLLESFIKDSRRIKARIDADIRDDIPVINKTIKELKVYDLLNEIEACMIFDDLVFGGKYNEQLKEIKEKILVVVQKAKAVAMITASESIVNEFINEIDEFLDGYKKFINKKLNKRVKKIQNKKSKEQNKKSKEKTNTK